MVIMKFGGRGVTDETMCRIDTPIEQEYYRYGGVLSYVLCKMLGKGEPVGAR